MDGLKTMGLQYRLGKEKKEEAYIPQVGGVNKPLIMEDIICPCQDKHYEADYPYMHPHIPFTFCPIIDQEYIRDMQGNNTMIPKGCVLKNIYWSEYNNQRLKQCCRTT